jgi:sulfite exporter TauE/SafE
MGVSATMSCLSICMPLLLPFLLFKDNTPKKALMTTLMFSAGRLLVYFSLGVVVYFLFSDLVSDYGSANVGGLRIIPLAVGAVALGYGAWVLFRLPELTICPAKYARRAVTVVLGMLIGSFLCPPYIIMLSASLGQSFVIYSASIFAFWVGSSLSIVLMGLISGRVSAWLNMEKNREVVKNVCAILMIFSGCWFIISALL